MFYQPFFAELRRQAEAEKKALWQAAEEEIARYRREAEARWARQEAAAEEERQQAAVVRRREIRVAAEQEGLRLKGEAEVALADRLFHLARRVMPVLQDEVRGEVFVCLAEELPRCPWDRVHVNPSDLAWAREFFPQAEVVADGDITGGVEALDRAGGVRVINTLEKRLERGWPAILPAIFAELKALDDDHPAR